MTDSLGGPGVHPPGQGVSTLYAAVDPTPQETLAGARSNATIRRSDLLSAAELRALSRAPAWVTVLPLLACYGIVGGTIAVAEWSDHLAVYALAALVIVSRTHAIGILMHEFAHDHVFKSRRLNLIGGELASLFLPFSMSRHRATHLLHHRFTSTDRDPDWLQFKRTMFGWMVSPSRGRMALIAHHLFAASGLAGIGVFLSDNWLAIQNVLGRPPFLPMTMSIAKDASGKIDKSATALLVVPRWADALTLTVVATAATGIITFHLYSQFILYYFVPNFMLFALFAYIRVQTEHWGEFDDRPLLTPTRTVTRSILGNLFFAPYNINFHTEHHLFPQVPWCNLERLHDKLCENRVYKEVTVIHRSHLGAIRRHFRKAVSDFVA